MKTRSACRSTAGFTRTELTATFAAFLLLASVSAPVWGNGGLSRSMVCMDNLRRLQTAWLLYTTEMHGVMPGNYHGGFVPTGSERPWATGWLDWSTSADNTNTTYLTQARYAALAVYLEQDVTVYRCPADDYVSVAQGARGWPPRVRSYSMNCFMGEGNAATSGPTNKERTFYRRLSDLRTLSPQQAFVFLEEHPDSINDPLFWGPNSPTNMPDLPGALHDGASWLTYADGHLESRRWSNRSITSEVRFINRNNWTVPEGDPDLGWLLEHASELR